MFGARRFGVVMPEKLRKPLTVGENRHQNGKT